MPRTMMRGLEAIPETLGQRLLHPSDGQASGLEMASNGIHCKAHYAAEWGIPIPQCHGAQRGALLASAELSDLPET